jgi:hypothetical protein
MFFLPPPPPPPPMDDVDEAMTAVSSAPSPAFDDENGESTVDLWHKQLDGALETLYRLAPVHKEAIHNLYEQARRQRYMLDVFGAVQQLLIELYLGPDIGEPAAHAVHQSPIAQIH